MSCMSRSSSLHKLRRDTPKDTFMNHVPSCVRFFHISLELKSGYCCLSSRPHFTDWATTTIIVILLQEIFSCNKITIPTGWRNLRNHINLMVNSIFIFYQSTDPSLLLQTFTLFFFYTVLGHSFNFCHVTLWSVIIVARYKSYRIALLWKSVIIVIP